MAEMGENPAEYHTLPRKQIGKTKVYIAVTVFIALLLVPAAFLLWLAFCPGETLRLRLSFSAMAAMCFVLPVRFAWVSIRRKWKTGQWSPTEQELQELRAKEANQGTAAWLRFVPSCLKNESTDPRGLKLIMAVFTTFLTVLGAILAIRHHIHGWALLSPVPLVLITANSIWDLFRKPKYTPSSAVTPSN
jgi:hypothetical protein